MKDDVVLKDSEILKEVRKIVERSNRPEIQYICRAISCITEDFDHTLIKWINKMLSQHCSIFRWNEVKGIHTDWNVWMKVAAKATRLAWLDWMITYCEIEEDLSNTSHKIVKVYEDGTDYFYELDNGFAILKEK